jgi:hypothetical protein
VVVVVERKEDERVVKPDTKICLLHRDETSQTEVPIIQGIKCIVSLIYVTMLGRFDVGTLIRLSICLSFPMEQTKTTTNVLVLTKFSSTNPNVH